MTPEQFAEVFKQEKSKVDAWFAALDTAKPSAPLVVEFVSLFPGAVVNYRYFTRTHEPGFDVGVDLHGRYEFTMQLPVRFDTEGRTVIGYGEPNFYLVEVASQKGRETRHDPTGERHFGSANGEKLLRAAATFQPLATRC